MASNLGRVQFRTALESLLRLRAVAEEFRANGRNWRLGFEALESEVEAEIRHVTKRAEIQGLSASEIGLPEGDSREG